MHACIHLPPRVNLILWHNEIRDPAANLLTKVCHDMCVELDLQPPHRGGPVRFFLDWAGMALVLILLQLSEWGGRYEVDAGVGSTKWMLGWVAQSGCWGGRHKVDAGVGSTKWMLGWMAQNGCWGGYVA